MNGRKVINTEAGLTDLLRVWCLMLLLEALDDLFSKSHSYNIDSLENIHDDSAEENTNLIKLIMCLIIVPGY